MHRYAIIVLTVLAMSTHADSLPDDDWEGFNRSMFAVNKTLDRWVLKPVAQSYQFVTPEPVDQSVTRFFSNLDDLFVIANNVLQLKLLDALSDSARFLVNSSLGFFGVFDVATPMGLVKHNEDFGQTLAVWGMASGPYVVWPILGPNTLRSTLGAGVHAVSGLGYGSLLADSYYEQLGLTILNNVDKRADLIRSEGLIYGDEYSFLRVVYLQRRSLLISDGKTKDEIFDDEFESDGF